MSDLETPGADRPGIDRRALIKRAAATGAVAWTAPLILDSLASPAAAVTGGGPGCKSVQIQGGNCITSVAPTFGPGACTPPNWATTQASPCPAFDAGQNLASTLCITASPACATNTNPIAFTIGAGCNCTFEVGPGTVAGIGQTNGVGADICRPGVLAPGNKTITFTFGATGTAWTVFRLRVVCT